MQVQGSELYVLDPVSHQAIQIACPSSLDIDPGSRDQIELECISRLERHYRAGMANPGNVTFPINYEPSDASHQLLRELYGSGQVVRWAFGYSDGTGIAPGVDQDTDGEYDLTPSNGRSWEIFSGYVDGFSLSAPYNGEVTGNVSVQISGKLDSYDIAS